MIDQEQTTERQSLDEKLLAIGQTAKRNQYQNLLRRIAAGEVLSASELSALKYLEKELQNKITDEPNVLPNPTAVHAYLKARGWKVAPRTVYKHAEEGRIRPRPDGQYTTQQADRYAATFLKRLDGTSSTPELDRLQRDKVVEETRRTRAQADHWDFKTRILKETYVPKDAFERALATRASVVKSDLENLSHTLPAELVARFGIAETYIPDLTAFLADRFEAVLARYAENRALQVYEQPPTLSILNDEDDDEGGEE